MAALEALPHHRLQREPESDPLGPKDRNRRQQALTRSLSCGNVLDMSRSGLLVQVGGITASLGGTLAVGFFLFVLESGGAYWTWPGWLGAGTTAIGLVAVAMGLALRDPSEDPVAAQHQSGGNHSRNYQAGRDVNIGSEGDHE